VPTGSCAKFKRQSNRKSLKVIRQKKSQGILRLVVSFVADNLKSLRSEELVMTPTTAFISSLLLAEGYSQYTTPVEKVSWHNQVKIHHGEAGVIIALLGALTGSKSATAFGLGLALHDHKDAGKWFRQDTLPLSFKP